MNRTLLYAAALASFAGAATSAGAAPSSGWLPPTVLAPGSSDARLAVAPTGLTIATWSTFAPTFTIRTAVRDGGAPWQPAGDLGYLGSSRIAVDGAGNALVVGARPDGNRWRVVAFTRPAATGTWSDPLPISEAGPGDDGPTLAANGAGQAVAGWLGREGDLTVARAALRRRDGTWTQPENLGYAGHDAPQVALDGRGGAVAVWARGDWTGATVYAESRAPDGAWQPAVVLSNRASDAYWNVGVTMNSRGDALAVWGEAGAVVSSLRRAGATEWAAPKRVSISSPWQALGAYDGFAFVLDEAGNATLVSQTGDGKVEAAALESGAPEWSGPVVLGDGGNGDWYTHDPLCVRPQIALDATGGAVVIWGGAALYAARRPAQAVAWERAVVADGPVCWGRAMSLDSSGNAVALWNAGAPHGSTRLESAVLDVTPPVIEHVSLPRAARAGRRARFMVGASDRWSQLQAPRWQFGDGASANGSVVYHTYRRPGRYRVTVSVTDSAQNSATSTTAVVVRRR